MYVRVCVRGMDKEGWLARLCFTLYVLLDAILW